MKEEYLSLVKKSKSAQKYFCFLLIVIMFSGCASTQIAMKNNATFKKYKKIYLIKPNEDPRNVIPRVAKQLEKMGFQVIMTEEDDPLGGVQGSGFIISSDGYLLTSAHVLNKKDNATVWINGKRYEADLIYKEESEDDTLEDKKKTKKSIKEEMQSSLNSKENQSIYERLQEKDLALLKIKDPDQPFSPLIFARDPLYKMGEEVYTIGFPLSSILGDTPRLNKGFISSTVGLKDSPNYLQFSAEIQPGNSGSPLLNNEGQVVGLIQMTLDPIKVMESSGGNLPQNVNFALKSQNVKDFIKNCNSKRQIMLKEIGNMDFDSVKQSIAQVRSGIIPESFKDEPKLVCSIAYLYFWDLWYRFQSFDVIFYDLDTQEILLRAGQYGDNPFSNEDGTIKKTFDEIKSKIRN